MNLNLNDIIDLFFSDNIISVAISIVAILICIVSVIALFVSIYLAIRYVKFNKKLNSAGLTGEQAARNILDMFGLQHIKVSATGSVMFGNSYSHYFKKVRLRRRTWKKASVASLAMAAQKSSLAILDKEKDPDMKRRVRLVPIMTFGPFAFIPLLIIGVLIDYMMHKDLGLISITFTMFGLVFYLISFLLSLTVLRTEKKAQDRALYILEYNGMATQEELRDMKTLFKLYNIEYVNDMVLSLLELIYNVLQIIAMIQGKSSSTSKD